MPQMRVADAELAQRCRAELDEIDGRIRPGTLRGVGPTIAKLADLDFFRQAKTESPRQTVARLQGDMNQFARENDLEHVVAVNLASTEPVVDASALPSRWAELEPLLAASSCPLPASSLYAIAALGLGFSYVNFTPSLGAAPAAIDELSRSARRASRRLRRQDRRDALEERPGPAHGPAELARPQLGRP